MKKRVNKFLKQAGNKYQNLLRKCTGIISSTKFLYVIVGLFILQAAWIAISFSFPMIFDESYHFPIIKIFSEQFTPIIINQPPEYDFLRDLTNGSSNLYHYLMSYPYRAVSIFTDSEAVHIVTLRLINILFAAIGIILFARTFKKIGIKQVYINIGLLIFTLIPLFPLTAAHINYDNLLFPLLALYLLICLRILKTRNVYWQDYTYLIIIGCSASLVKFTFLPIFAASIIYLAIAIFKNHRSKFFPKLFKSIKFSSKISIGIITFLLLITVGLFSSIYIKNVVVYGTPKPSCAKTLGKDRCSASPVIDKYQEALQTKSQRTALSLPEVASGWFVRMTSSFGSSSSNVPERGVVSRDPLPIMRMMMFFGTIAYTGFLLYSWRRLPKNQGWYFLLFIAIVEVAAVFIKNVEIYYKYNAFYAVQPRYLLPILPILLVMAVSAFGFILKDNKAYKAILLTFVLILFTQGAGALTHIVRSEPDWYWDNERIRQTNRTVQNAIKPLVRENYGKYGF